LLTEPDVALVKRNTSGHQRKDFRGRREGALPAAVSFRVETGGVLHSSSSVL
jgi:hypothetical protein